MRMPITGTRTAIEVAAEPALSPASLLGLMRLASPALPVGGYSYSEGLEAAIDAALVVDEDSARRWLLDQMALSLARSELPLLAQAHAAWSAWDIGVDNGQSARIVALNDWAVQTRESSEFRQQSLQMGRSLAEWLRGQHGDTDSRLVALRALAPAPTWPVGFALAAVWVAAPVSQTLLAFAFSWAENMVQAAVKAVPFGQSAGQRLLRSLVQALPALAETAALCGDDARQNFAPMLAIRSSLHEAQYSRLFRS